MRSRSVDLQFQADDRRPRDELLDRMNVPATINHHASFARQQQTDRSARGAYVDRFEIRVEDQHGFVHPVSVNGMIILPLLNYRKLMRVFPTIGCSELEFINWTG